MEKKSYQIHATSAHTLFSLRECQKYPTDYNRQSQLATSDDTKLQGSSRFYPSSVCYNLVHSRPSGRFVLVALSLSVFWTPHRSVELVRDNKVPGVIPVLRGFRVLRSVSTGFVQLVKFKSFVSVSVKWIVSPVPNEHKSNAFCSGRSFVNLPNWTRCSQVLYWPCFDYNSWEKSDVVTSDQSIFEVEKMHSIFN